MRPMTYPQILQVVRSRPRGAGMIAGTSVTDWLSATAGTFHRESYLFVRGAEEVRVGQWSAAVAVVGTP